MRERRAVCQYITANYGYNYVTFNYRLAPENLWSAPLEGCLTAYAARLKTGASPKDVVFMGGKRRRYAGVVISVAAEGKGISPAEALVPLSPCVTQADCFPSHTRNCGNRLRRPLCRFFPILPVPKRQAAEQRLSVWNITESACMERRCSRMETGLFPPSSTPTVRRAITKQI